jgi:TRAP-type mannitol/chloroaromatic compound transport system permease large subunit
MDDITIGFIGTGVLITLVLAGVRVVYATAAVGLLGLVAMIGWDAGATNIGMIPHAKGSLYALSVIPMFILIGFLAFHAGMTQSLFDAARKWLGWVPGGLAVARYLPRPASRRYPAPVPRPPRYSAASPFPRC